MPRILLDRHIDEAAMTRRAKSIQPRRSHRPRRGERVTVADVVRMAAVQAPTTRPAVDPDDELTTFVISTGPAVTYAIPAPPADFVPYPLATAAPLAPGHAHADVVLAELAAAAAEVEHPAVPVPADAHVVHHQLPKPWLCTVPLVDPDAALADEVELLIARFACAVSDLVVRPGGVHALIMLCAPYARAPLSTWDHRPLNANIGYELPDDEPAIHLDDLPDWVRESVLEPHGTFHAAIHRHATGAHLTSVQLNVAVDEGTGEPTHLCHICDDDPDRRRDFTCFAPASTVTVLTLSPAVAA